MLRSDPGIAWSNPRIRAASGSAAVVSGLDQPLGPDVAEAPRHGVRSVEPSAGPSIDELERARPPIGEEPVILGLSRRSHSRVGSRVFTLFFVFVFGLITVQMFVALLIP